MDSGNQELPLGAIAHQLRVLMSNAAGLLELLFLILVFVVYLLLARRPGKAVSDWSVVRIYLRFLPLIGPS
eukprot:1181682-Prorocentrum_minimum.AAC.7